MTILKYKILKDKHIFLIFLALTAPLGFLPILPNRLYFTWLLMFQGLLKFPRPSYPGLWLECLCLDFLYDIPIGASFLSFSMICLAVSILCKYLLVTPFAVLWSVATIIMICLDVLFFQSIAWQMLTEQKSWSGLGAIVGAYPFIAYGVRILCKRQMSSFFQYSLFEQEKGH